MALVSRDYLDDRAAMAALLLETRPPALLTEFPGLLDLEELLATDEGHENARLWWMGGSLAAFALLQPRYGNLDFEIHPALRDIALEDAIIAWAEDRLRRLRPDEPGLCLDVACRDDDAARLAILERCGFERLPDETVRLARSLAGDIPAPVLPPGFSIRPVAGEDEIDALVALFREAFGTHNMTPGERLAMMRAAGYERALDLLAVAPDGTPAAFVIAHINPEENRISGEHTGWTDPLGTRPQYRRLGLMNALLDHACALLKTRGMDTAMLGTSSQNTAALAAFTAAGFHIVSRRGWYSKRLQI